MKTLTLTETLGYKGAIIKGTSSPIVKGQVMKSRTHYFAGFLNQLTNGAIVESKNDDIVGVRSIKGNKLPAGVSFLVTGVRVLFDTSAGLQAGAGIPGAAWASVAPVNFKNGELSIRQGNETFTTSGTDVTNFKASTGNGDDFREVVPFELRPETSFEIIASLGAAAAADQAYKIELRGIEFVDTDKS
jgi:hypothetical protein